MSKAGGVVLILSGLAVGAYAVPHSEWGDVFATQPGVGGPTAGSATALTPPDLVVPVPRPAYRPIPAVAHAAEPLPSFSSPVVVTVAPRSSDPLPPPVSGSPIPKDRDLLARELQKELRRVGCYDGEVHGAWTQSTRRAMKAFTDRINASLPVDEPDAVLLALVQGQRGSVCGQPCPHDQGLSHDGRCIPNAILAKAARKGAPTAASASLPTGKSDPAVSGWSTVTRAADTPAITAAERTTPTQPPIDGRMALAGPSEGEPSSAQPPTSVIAPDLRAPAPPPPPKKSAKNETSWARAMRARYFGSPN